MRIILKPKDATLKEWGLIEIQGKITSKKSTTLHNMSLGDLQFNTKNDPVLTIGNSVLSGKCVKLKKPLIITGKKGVYNESEKKYELNILGIIKQKYVFKQRPKIILLNSIPSKQVVHIN
mmetsp:Transcript_62334/g.76352  ORF Transcript_62334/g.76352 Transcript_62334/m.76352 type:complete len:120 (-) Transcript_62334:201-560(-)